MMKAIDFYNAARGSNSHYRMAQVLGVSEQAIGKWVKGGAIKAYYVIKCAKMAGLDVREAALTATFELEHDEDKKKELADMLTPSYNTSSLKTRGALAQLVEQRTLNP